MLGQVAQSIVHANPVCVHGRPKKVSVVQETPYRSHSEGHATRLVVEPISITAELDTMVLQDDGPSNYASSAVLKLMIATNMNVSLYNRFQKPKLGGI